MPIRRLLFRRFIMIRLELSYILPVLKLLKEKQVTGLSL